MIVGYARTSTVDQLAGFEAQLQELHTVRCEKIFREQVSSIAARAELQATLDFVRAGDVLIVTKLDRLARSVPDAHGIAQELAYGGVKLNIGGSVHDPHDPMGKLMFNVLAMIAEFEADLIRLRTREGMKIAKAKGRLRGKQPKLTKAQHRHLMALHQGGEHTSAELAELFGVARSTIYRTIGRMNRPDDTAVDRLATG